MHHPEDPIARPLSGLPEALHVSPTAPGMRCIRVTARALEGMQKEAVVTRDDSGSGWWLLCDEGPYLRGTDLAPPPLSFFAAGMAAHHAALLSDEAGRHEPAMPLPAFSQHTAYSMEGSALKGTMTGGAMPVEWVIDAAPGEADARAAQARAALQRSLAEDLMAHAYRGHFSLTANGERRDTGRVAGVDGPVPDMPWAMLEAGLAGPPGDRALIGKVSEAECSNDPTH